ncbi:MAG: DNA polymerase IV [Chloroflexi bacterium]|nr:MAG: DNA polymerase IV [Chloroflexota bacterium]
MASRKVIHLDLDAFFCSVEELRRPELRGKPFAVGGRPETRGVIASCSYAARMCGVHSAMPTSRALRLCPELILISGEHGYYSEYSRKVMTILGRYSGLIEQVSIDEAFLDVSDLARPGVEIARDIQQVIRQELDLPCSLGIASNKLVAKIATDAGKAGHRGITPPCAILEVPAGGEADFLAPMPVQALWGVGPKTAARLKSLGIHTIGDLARQPEQNLEKLFGKYGHDISRHARGVDNSPIEPEHDIKSISQETTFDRDIADAVKLHQVLRNQSEKVAFRLRSKNLTATTVRIKVRWPDFSTQSRQLTLPQATNQDTVITHGALTLFDSLWDGKIKVRLIGVGVSGLQPEIWQPSLWDTPNDKERRLLAAMDELKDRYGRKIVQRGAALKPKNQQDDDP